MEEQVSIESRSPKILDLPAAAEAAGFTSRHFRKIIEEDRIPVMRIGKKVFIVANDLEAWKSTRGEMRFEAALQQLDRWIQEDAARSSAAQAAAWEAMDF